MRIIAGCLRGRTLAAPAGHGTRPITDRTKQALFDWLAGRFGEHPSLPAIDVLDLFAGAGSLGIEALSRGAAFCGFVEQAPEALRVLRANLASLSLEADRAVVVAADALTGQWPESPAGGYGLVFCDPPYRLSAETQPAGPVPRLLARLGGSAARPAGRTADSPRGAGRSWCALAAGAIVALRHDAGVRYDSMSFGRLRWRQRRDYGGMAIDLFGLD